MIAELEHRSAGSVVLARDSAAGRPCLILAHMDSALPHRLETLLSTMFALTRLQAYALALLLFGAAVLARLGLDFLVPDRLPYAPFFAGVIAVAYCCGLGPSILVLVLSSLAGAAWIDPSGTDIALLRIVGVSVFLLVGGLNIALVHQLVQAYRHIKQQDQQLSLINAELKHRIKNLFSITNAICLQTIRSGSAVDEMAASVSGRIMALAAAQDFLGTSAKDGADLKALVTALVAILAPAPTRLNVEGEPVKLPADATTPFAQILHELATNALKYGAWHSPHGFVSVSWRVQSGYLNFEWREHDGLEISPPLRNGLGTALIKSGLPNAKVEHEIKSDGVQCRIALPLAY